VAVNDLSAVAVARAVELRWTDGGLVVARSRVLLRVLAVEWRSVGSGVQVAVEWWWWWQWSGHGHGKGKGGWKGNLSAVAVARAVEWQ
jgi:hypothetical protein